MVKDSADSIRLAALEQLESRSERFNAREIMIRESVSIQYVGGEP